ncbi:MAG: hypothetical protein SOX57_07375 [Schaalia hyovaginalis]|uniref:hypothetical protein n=1 Tax=Schaalia hyovaginalis TaxID=29316 RepID=UPI002A802D0E|nr:hypothetical protein [Schaalia hyovaginalis]MDY4263135.1 hypothetical protein [Schaalia hyovaginalis]
MTDPVDKLLQRDEHREDMLRALGLKLSTLLDVTDEYRAAWRVATSVGWAKADLLKVGFVDPTRLPRRSTPRRIENED